MVAHNYITKRYEAEAGESGVLDYAWLHTEFKAITHSMKDSNKTKQ